jgi:hypothetical protein
MILISNQNHSQHKNTYDWWKNKKWARRDLPSCDEHANKEGKNRENWNPFSRDFGRSTSLHVCVDFSCELDEELEEEEVIDIGTLVGMSKNELVYGFWLMSATIDVFSSFPFLYKKIIH